MSRSQATQSAAASALQVKIKPPPVRRQPPPPPRHRSGSTMDGLTDSLLKTVPTTKKTDEEEKGNSEIDTPTKRAKVNNGQSQSRPYYKRLDLLNTNINSLPDELVVDILVHIPAQDIYSAVMTVCFKWYKIIHTHTFINTHLHHSTYGLIAQNQVSQTNQLTFMTLSRQGRVELTRLNYEAKYKIWCNSCNGLILEWVFVNQSSFYITNPATMQHFALPPFFDPMYFTYSAFAYASVSMEYKVVIVFRQEKEWCCAILTVGVDESWRPVRTQHLSLESKKLLVHEPFTTEGFVHWAYRGNYVLTLNVETEIITEYSVPSLSSGDDIIGHHYHSAAKYLTLLIEFRGWLWEVWEMKPETGEWTKLPGIEIHDLKDRKGQILGWIGNFDTKFKCSGSGIIVLSVGWLKYKEVLLFKVYSPDMRLAHRFCFAWNVRTKEIQFIELDSNEYPFLVHRHSLVWLDGC
ncbi:hypothetical protein CASFOL_030011 [Castilleja foliolosa]|uniref:F-box domain-containing protein n=1 Tax=Castilleja foliolosa TaxID=1961234 RepID=A0ABD3CCL6_9LAMI